MAKTEKEPVTGVGVLLNDVMDVFGAYNGVSHVWIEHAPLHIVGTHAIHKQLQIRGYPKTDYPEIAGLCCLGSLKYLKSIVSRLITQRGFKVDLQFREIDEQPTLFKAVFATGRTEIPYQAKDPTVLPAGVKRPGPEKNVAWPIKFPIPPDVIEEMRDFTAVQGASDYKTERIFFQVEKNKAKLILGSRDQVGGFMLTDDAGTDQSWKAELRFDEFLTAMNRGAKTGVNMCAGPFGVRIEFETAVSLWAVTLAAKKDPNAQVSR